jgi:hypothetical protein
VLAERCGYLLAQAGRSEGGEGATEGTPATRHGIRLLRAGVATLTEQELHLLLGDDAAVGEVEAGDAVAEPAARGLALLLVVRSEPDLAALGPVVHSDLPGQVRVPAPGGELVQRHHTPQSRGREVVDSAGHPVHQVCSRTGWPSAVGRAARVGRRRVRMLGRGRSGPSSSGSEIS